MPAARNRLLGNIMLILSLTQRERAPGSERVTGRLLEVEAEKASSLFNTSLASLAPESTRVAGVVERLRRAWLRTTGPWPPARGRERARRRREVMVGSGG